MRRDPTTQKTEEVPYCFAYQGENGSVCLDLSRADWMTDAAGETTLSYSETRFVFTEEQSRIAVKNAWCRAKHLGDDIQRIFPPRREQGNGTALPE